MRIEPIQRYIDQYPDDVEVVRTTFEEEYDPTRRWWNCVFRRTVRYRGGDMPIHYYLVRHQPLLPQSMDEVVDGVVDGEEGVYEFHREQAEAAWLRSILDREGLDREFNRRFTEAISAAREAEAARVEALLREWAELDEETEDRQRRTGEREEIDDYTVYW